MRFKNYRNPYTKNNRIYSKSDVANMTVKDVFGSKQELMAQNRSIGLPSDRELMNSENVVWVESYTRDDGTEVKAHYRSKPGHGSIGDENTGGIFDSAITYPFDEKSKKDDVLEDYDLAGDEDENPVVAWVNIALEIAKVLFKDTEVGKVLETISPLAQIILPMILEEDDTEDVQTEPVTDSEEKEDVLQKENSQQEPEKEKFSKDESITGGASEIKQEMKEKKDVPEMTKSAKLQEVVAKNNPKANSYPEQEYYKISLNLDKVRETGKIPDWMKEHNDIRTLDKIGNKELAEKIREKVIECAKENNDQDTLKNPNNVFVITVRPSSDLTNLIINDTDFNKDLETKLQDIKNGKYENSAYSFVFKDNVTGQKDIDKKFSTNHTISKCDVHNVKIDSNGYLTATIIDYYDFSKNGGFINNNAYIQQQNKKLENYALVIPIRMKIKKKQ